MANSSKFDLKRIPVFIGVTGHRSIRSQGDDIVRLKKAVKDAILEICGKCRHTDFILLTSLAAGADQIAAEAVVEMAEDSRYRNKSIKFAVVLPMEKKKFFTRVGDKGPDFTLQQMQNAERLMSSEHCAFVYTIPEQEKSDMDGDISEDDLQFREAARFISDSSFAGIALWDGMLDHRYQAGTGPTVRDFLHGKAYRRNSRPRISIPETRPIYHIFTPQEGAEPVEGLDYSMRKLFPEPLLETGENWFTLNGMTDDEKIKAFSNKNKWNDIIIERELKTRSHLKSIERFNKDIVTYSRRIEKKGHTLNRKKSVWNENSAFCEPDDNSGMFLHPEKRAELCEKYYREANTLTMAYQCRRRQNIWWIVWIAGFAYLALNIFSGAFDNPWILLLYIVLFLVALLIHFREKKMGFHTKFVDYRALAEGLRVQYFWYAADVMDKNDSDKDEENREPAQAQNYYLRRQKGQLEWVRHAIRGINLLAIAMYDDKREADLEEIKKVSELWLGRMDVKDKETGKWYNPTYGLKQNGQVGYFLATSLKSRKGVNLKERDVIPEKKTAAERKAFNKKLKGEKLSLSWKFRVSRLLKFLTHICVGTASVITLIIAVCLFAVPDTAAIEQFTGYAMFVAGLLPVVAMVLREIAGQMGYEEDVDRYAWYYNAFKRAIIEIDEICNDKDIRRSDEEKTVEIKKILFEIGEEALIENADWVMLNAKRVPEVPTN